MPYYNCHAHIFNQACAPERFLEGYTSHWKAVLIRRVTGVWVGRALLRFLSKRFVPPSVRRVLSFLSIGAEKYQEDVFYDLKSAYPAETRLVALTLNLEHMGAGECNVDYKTQLDEVLRIKRKYPDVCLPFVCLDPRMNPQRFGGNNLAEVAQRYVAQGFVGIKLYPALGFYPNDSALYPVYEFAEAHDVPILVHCDRGGAFYRSGQAGFPPALYPYPWLNLAPNQTDNDYSDNYLEPLTYELLLNGDPFRQIQKKFPKLKLCLAHFGGVNDITAEEKVPNGKTNNWYVSIKSLIAKYDNVYADVSYVLADSAACNTILADLKTDPKLASRVLFGTDFYMVEQENPEVKVLQTFQEVFGTALFGQLSQTNARAFLSSAFYTAP